MTALPSTLATHPPDSGTRHIARSLWLRGLLGDVTARPEVDGLAARMREVFLPKGAFLYRAGSASDQICFVVSGKIQQGDHGYHVFGSGDALGFVDSMRERPHKWDARALQDSVVLFLRVDDWLEFLEDNFEFFRQMMFRRVAALPADPHGIATSVGNASKMLADLSATEESITPVTRFVRTLVALHSCPLLERATIQAVAQLARRAEAIRVRKTAVTTRGRSRGLWIVAEGQVEAHILYDGRRIKEQVGPAALIGSLMPLRHEPEVFEVRGAPRGTVLWIGEEAFFDVMEDHFDVARSALGYMAALVETLNSETDEGWTQRAGRPSAPRGS